MPTIGFLHTSPLHSTTFRSLVAELLPGVETVEVIDELVLDQADRLGLDDVRVIGAIADRIAELVVADVVVCTCSALGGLAEQIGRAAGSEVVRVDRAMVVRATELAAAADGRVTVVATRESTLGPTAALFDEVMLATGVVLDVSMRHVSGAWEQFVGGDVEGHLDRVATELDSVAADSDVVVLAQASSAPAVGRVDLGIPVLSSPRLAIEALRPAFV